MLGTEFIGHNVQTSREMSYVVFPEHTVFPDSENGCNDCIGQTSCSWPNPEHLK